MIAVDLARTLSALRSGTVLLPTPELPSSTHDALLRSLLPADTVLVNLTDFDDGRAYAYFVYAATAPGLTEFGPGYHRALDALGGRVDGFRVLLSAVGPFAAVECRVFRKAPPVPFYDVVAAHEAPASVAIGASLREGLQRAGFRVLSADELLAPVDFATELKDEGMATVLDAIFDG